MSGLNIQFLAGVIVPLFRKARGTCTSHFTFHSSLKKRAAFTLAEVLITIGIIGVVAAMTMPVLIQNYQKKATAMSVKKAYSELNQIIKMAEADYGDSSGWDYYEQANLAKWVQTYIEPYVKVVNSGTCASGKKCLGISLIYHLGYNLAANNANPSRPQYIVVKGGDSIAYAFYRYDGVYEPVTRVRVYIRNPKKFAFVGKDVFTFVFDKSKQNPMFEPYGMGTSREDLLADRKMWAGACNPNASGSGYWSPGDACTAVIMLDGWEIKSDYPW